MGGVCEVSYQFAEIVVQRCITTPALHSTSSLGQVPPWRRLCPYPHFYRHEVAVPSVPAALSGPSFRLIEKKQKIKAGPTPADAPLRGREELELASLRYAQTRVLPVSPPALCVRAAGVAQAAPPSRQWDPRRGGAALTLANLWVTISRAHRDSRGIRPLLGRTTRHGAAKLQEAFLCYAHAVHLEGSSRKSQMR